MKRRVGPTLTWTIIGVVLAALALASVIQFG